MTGFISVRYLIQDHEDTKFTGLSDTRLSLKALIFGISSAAPNANVIANGWVRFVREDCLDRPIILHERHLRRVLTKYIAVTMHGGPIGGLIREVHSGWNPRRLKSDPLSKR